MRLDVFLARPRIGGRIRKERDLGIRNRIMRSNHTFILECVGGWWHQIPLDLYWYTRTRGRKVSSSRQPAYLHKRADFDCSKAALYFTIMHEPVGSVEKCIESRTRKQTVPDTGQQQVAQLPRAERVMGMGNAGSWEQLKLMLCLLPGTSPSLQGIKRRTLGCDDGLSISKFWCRTAAVRATR
jgi:hypothetical protein